MNKKNDNRLHTKHLCCCYSWILCITLVYIICKESKFTESGEEEEMKFEVSLDKEEIRDIIRKCVAEEMKKHGLFRFIRENVRGVSKELFGERKNSIDNRLQSLNIRLTKLEQRK